MISFLGVWCVRHSCENCFTYTRYISIYVHVYKYIKRTILILVWLLYVNIIENEKNNKFTMSLHIVLKWYWIWCGWCMLSNIHTQIWMGCTINLFLNFHAHWMQISVHVFQNVEREREKKSIMNLILNWITVQIVKLQRNCRWIRDISKDKKKTLW